MAKSETHRDQIIGAIDSINLGSDLLRTAWLATRADNGLEKEDIEAISCTLYHAITRMEPGREALLRVVGEMR